MAKEIREFQGKLIADIVITCPQCGGGLWNEKGTIFRSDDGYNLKCTKCNKELFIRFFEEAYLMGQLDERRKWEDRIIKMFELENRCYDEH